MASSEINKQHASYDVDGPDFVLWLQDEQVANEEVSETMDEAKPSRDKSGRNETSEVGGDDHPVLYAVKSSIRQGLDCWWRARKASLT